MSRRRKRGDACPCFTGLEPSHCFEPKSDVTRQVCSPSPLLPCALCPSDGPPPWSVFRLPGSPQQARRNQPRLFTLASRARLRSALRVFSSATHASFSPSSPELPGTASASKRKTVSHPKCSSNEMGPPRSASGSHVPIPTPRHIAQAQMLIKGIRTEGGSEHTGSWSPSVPSTPTPGPSYLQMGAASFLTHPGEAQPLLHLLSLNMD